MRQYHSERFELVSLVCEHAAHIVNNTAVSVAAALQAACERTGIILDEDSHALALVSLGKFRDRLEGTHHDRSSPNTRGN